MVKPSRVAESLVNASRRLVLDARRAALIFREEADLRPIESTWQEAAGELVEGISHGARFADLLILGQYDQQVPVEAHPLPIAHSVLLKCGRPVLVVPPLIEPTIPARVVVAWDGSREAVRSLHDALPLLRLASSIEVLNVTRTTAERLDADMNSLAEHLARHDLKVEPKILQTVTEAEHKLLREQIEQGQYDLLVMGGYSHPVWLEFIFGGATELILGSSKIPVFVSH